MLIVGILIFLSIILILGSSISKKLCQKDLGVIKETSMDLENIIPEPTTPFTTFEVKGSVWIRESKNPFSPDNTVILITDINRNKDNEFWVEYVRYDKAAQRWREYKNFDPYNDLFQRYNTGEQLDE